MVMDCARDVYLYWREEFTGNNGAVIDISSYLVNFVMNASFFVILLVLRFSCCVIYDNNYFKPLGRSLTIGWLYLNLA